MYDVMKAAKNQSCPRQVLDEQALWLNGSIVIPCLPDKEPEVHT